MQKNKIYKNKKFLQSKKIRKTAINLADKSSDSKIHILLSMSNLGYVRHLTQVEIDSKTLPYHQIKEVNGEIEIKAKPLIKLFNLFEKPETREKILRLILSQKVEQSQHKAISYVRAYHKNCPVIKSLAALEQAINSTSDKNLCHICDYFELEENKHTDIISVKDSQRDGAPIFFTKQHKGKLTRENSETVEYYSHKHEDHFHFRNTLKSEVYTIGGKDFFGTDAMLLKQMAKAMDVLVSKSSHYGRRATLLSDPFHFILPRKYVVEFMKREKARCEKDEKWGILFFIGFCLGMIRNGYVTGGLKNRYKNFKRGQDNILELVLTEFQSNSSLLYSEFLLHTLDCILEYGYVPLIEFTLFFKDVNIVMKRSIHFPDIALARVFSLWNQGDKITVYENKNHTRFALSPSSGVFVRRCERLQRSKRDMSNRMKSLFDFAAPQKIKPRRRRMKFENVKEIYKKKEKFGDSFRKKNEKGLNQQRDEKMWGKTVTEDEVNSLYDKDVHIESVSHESAQIINLRLQEIAKAKKIREVKLNNKKESNDRGDRDPKNAWGTVTKIKNVPKNLTGEDSVKGIKKSAKCEDLHDTILKSLIESVGCSDDEDEEEGEIEMDDNEEERVNESSDDEFEI